MSDPFSRENNSVENIRSEALGKSAAAAEDLKARVKKFDTGKDIEEGLGGLKLGGSAKGILKAAKDNLGKYAKQELKKGYNQFKDKWSQEIKSRGEGYIKKGKDAAKDLKTKAEKAIQDAKTKAEEVANDAKTKAEELVDTAKGKVGDLKAQGEEAVSKLTDTTGEDALGAAVEEAPEAPAVVDSLASRIASSALKRGVSEASAAPSQAEILADSTIQKAVADGRSTKYIEDLTKISRSNTRQVARGLSRKDRVANMLKRKTERDAENPSEPLSQEEQAVARTARKGRVQKLLNPEAEAEEAPEAETVASSLASRIAGSAVKRGVQEASTTTKLESGLTEEQAAAAAQVRSGISDLKDQAAALRNGISKLGNSNTVPAAGGAEADAAAAAAKAAEKATADAAEKAAAEKAATAAAEKQAAKKLAEDAAKKLAEDGSIEVGAEITGEEAFGGFLDEIGLLPLGLVLGAVGVGTAIDEKKKNMPTLGSMSSMARQNNAGSSFQVGIS